MKENIPDNSESDVPSPGPPSPHVLSRMICPQWLGAQHGFVSPTTCIFLSPPPLLEKHQQETPLLRASGSCCYVLWENQLQPNYLSGLISIV